MRVNVSGEQRAIKIVTGNISRVNASGEQCCQSQNCSKIAASLRLRALIIPLELALVHERLLADVQHGVPSIRCPTNRSRGI